MEKAKKKGGAGLLISSIAAWLMLIYRSFTTYRGVGAVLLFAPEAGRPVWFSLYKFLLGSIFVIGTFLIGKKNDKKGVVITFSIVNMLVALAAFLPVRGYYASLLYTRYMFRNSVITGIACLIPYVFIALVFVFTLLIMLAAVKKRRRQPKGLCIAILVVMGVYTLFSIISLFFSNPYIYMRLGFVGLHNLRSVFNAILYSRNVLLSLLFPWSSTAHFLLPFATIAVYLAMFFAARGIRPSEAKQAVFEGDAYYAPPAQDCGKSKIAAAILAGALGNFGVHRYYLGYIGSGIVQSIGGMLYIIGYALLIGAASSYNPPIGMLVCGIILLLASLGTSIWALVDFIRILCNKLKPAGGEFGNAPQASAVQQNVYSAPQPDYFTPQPDYSAPQQPVYTAPVEEYTAPQETTSPAPANEANAQEDNLRKLDDMLAKGLVTMEEYIDIRRRLNGQ